MDLKPRESTWYTLVYIQLSPILVRLLIEHDSSDSWNIGQLDAERPSIHCVLVVFVVFVCSITF